MFVSSEELVSLVMIAKQIYKQQQKDKNKVYSGLDPPVECVSEGRIHKSLWRIFCFLIYLLFLKTKLLNVELT